MGIPQRTLDQLLNWLDRVIGDPQKTEHYQLHCKKFIGSKGLEAPPIPCPQCYATSGALNHPLHIIGEKIGKGIKCLKCDKCKLVFPEIVGISLDVLRDLISSGRLNELFAQLEFEDLWLIEGNNPKLKLTKENIQSFMQTNRFED